MKLVIPTGQRKLATYVLSLIFLLIGLVLALAWPAAGTVLYGIYAGGIASAQTIFTVGNTKENNVKGAQP